MEAGAVNRQALQSALRFPGLLRHQGASNKDALPRPRAEPFLSRQTRIPGPLGLSSLYRPTGERSIGRELAATRTTAGNPERTQPEFHRVTVAAVWRTAKREASGAS